ncbi:MAG: hypothetical protein Q8P84_04400 [Deltaproteobacteria bacterium]|nr:hypothetical protein [Deltaproteobacteria bacterium]MDZ4224695.1 hypothetical protein [bacterium]
MEPITLAVGGAVLLTAWIFGSGCKATVERPQKDGSSGNDGPDDLPAEDGGVDGGFPVRDAGEDAGVPDSGSDAGPDTGDGGDGGPFTREGIEERWARLTQCQIRGLNLIDQKLYGLCEGKPSRLVACPVSQNIEPVVCEEVVSFEEAPFEGETALELVPQIHSDVGDGFSVVTFNGAPGDKGAFFIVDRANKTITDKVALDHWHLISGGGEIDMVFPNPQGAMRFADELLIAFSNGVVFEFPWNENGTINWDTPALYFLNATQKNPSLFLKKDNANAWLVNNGSLSENSPAGIDRIDLRDFGAPPAGDTEEIRADIRPENNLLVGDVELNRLPALAASPDQGALLLAGGTLLIAVIPDAAENNIASLDLDGAQNIVSVQWYATGEKNRALATDSAGEVLAVTLENNQPVQLETAVPLEEGLGPSALDLSGCIFYQGVVLDADNSAISALSCGIFE